MRYLTRQAQENSFHEEDSHSSRGSGRRGYSRQNSGSCDQNFYPHWPANFGIAEPPGHHRKQRASAFGGNGRQRDLVTASRYITDPSKLLRDPPGVVSLPMTCKEPVSMPCQCAPGCGQTARERLTAIVKPCTDADMALRLPLDEDDYLQPKLSKTPIYLDLVDNATASGECKLILPKDAKEFVTKNSLIVICPNKIRFVLTILFSL